MPSRLGVFRAELDPDRPRHAVGLPEQLEERRLIRVAGHGDDRRLERGQRDREARVGRRAARRPARGAVGRAPRTRAGASTSGSGNVRPRPARSASVSSLASKNGSTQPPRGEHALGERGVRAGGRRPPAARLELLHPFGLVRRRVRRAAPQAREALHFAPHDVLGRLPRARPLDVAAERGGQRVQQRAAVPRVETARRPPAWPRESTSMPSAVARHRRLPALERQVGRQDHVGDRRRFVEVGREADDERHAFGELSRAAPGRRATRSAELSANTSTLGRMRPVGDRRAGRRSRPRARAPASSRPPEQAAGAIDGADQRVQREHRVDQRRRSRRRPR